MTNSTNSMNSPDTRSNHWNIVEIFHDGEVSVEVSKSSGYVPKYGLRIGWRVTTSQTAPITTRSAWMPYNGAADYSAAVSRCIAAAQAFVLHELEEWQHVEKLRAAASQKRIEERQERDRAKKKQYEANKDARREENRARAHGGKKGR